MSEQGAQCSGGYRSGQPEEGPRPADSVAAERARNEELRSRLAPIADLRWSERVPAADLTTFRVGGPVELLVEPQTVSALQVLLEACTASALKPRILGGGSNILLPDEGVSTLTIRLPRRWAGEVLCPDHSGASSTLLQYFDPRSDQPRATLPDSSGAPEVTLFVLGATPLMSLSRRLSSLGLGGFEFAAGIPALFGGAVRMNAGAHQHQMSDVVESVLVVSPDGALKTVHRTELGFAYRTSSLACGSVVLGATVRCKRRPSEASSEQRAKCLAYRKQTQPLSFPSAGSVFRNPSPESLARARVTDSRASAGWLLEQVGLKGERRGGIQYSPLHANWLICVDLNSATAADVRHLVLLGQQRVGEQFGIVLEPELMLW